jgi:hypothetical protein
MRSTSRLPDVISTSGRYEPPAGSALAALLALVSADDGSAKAEVIEAMVAADGRSPTFDALDGRDAEARLCSKVFLS